MVKFNCFSVLFGRKKKKYKKSFHANKNTSTLRVKLEQPIVSSKEDMLNSISTSFDVLVPFGIENKSTCEVKVLREENSPKTEAAEASYEGGDDSLSMKRELSDTDLQATVTYSGDSDHDLFISNNENSAHEQEKETAGFETVKSGHLSDPGIGKTAIWGSPKLKRSCSNLETGALLKKIENQLSPSKSHSYQDLRNLRGSGKGEVVHGQTSPLSVITSCSADRVMLKRRSSSQVLPSRSKRLWWKLFLWSHRNLHKIPIPKPKLFPVEDSLRQKDGYTSDRVEPSHTLERNKNEGKEPLRLQSPEIGSGNNYEKQNWVACHEGNSRFWHQNHWVAFSTEPSTFSRVDEWVRSLETEALVGQEVDGNGVARGENSAYPPSPETSRSPVRLSPTPLHSKVQVPEEVLHANNVIRSLNSFSTVAHVASMGLKVIPNMSPYSSLRSLNLSGNSIAHITPGFLPKGLHTLDLSRNKISTIEGLRELTRLRILDLSYNRISRIGHGLSKCTIIKELYLAGNKVIDVEGIHRLLKLTVLDLSFNKITTTKALGQLIANYNSLIALNLVGNPIQSNFGDDQLCKAVSGLLPTLVFLNKQPIKTQRAREVITDNVARAAFGSNYWHSRRKVLRQTSHKLSSRGKSIEGSSHRSRLR